jgi:ABC-type lipoprotein release transport system permease subunit
VQRFKLLAGRRPDPRRADEALVSFLVARKRDLHVGQRFTVHMLTGDGPRTRVHAVAFTVAGIEAAPAEFPPLGGLDSASPVYVTGAFARSTVGAGSAARAAILEVPVRLRHGQADVPQFLRDAEHALGHAVGSEVLVSDTHRVRRSMHDQATALRLTAAVIALTSALVLSQLLTRQIASADDDRFALRSLGMTRAQVVATSVLRIVVVAVVASLLAIAVAFVVSPLFPTGDARVAEPHVGFAFDAFTSVVGGAAIVFVVVALAAAVSVVPHRTAAVRPTHPGPVARAVASLPLPVVATTGIRMATNRGRGHRQTPVRVTVITAAVGIAAVTGTVTFAASLDHMLRSPQSYGVNFDVDLEAQGNFAAAAPFLRAVRTDPDVDAVAIATTGMPVRSGDVSFAAQQMTNVRGAIEPTLVDGRLPERPDEIVLGTRTAAQVGARIGSTISITVADVTSPIEMHVVGRAVLPPFTDLESLGRGAILSPAATTLLVAHAPPGFDVPPPSDLLVRFDPRVTSEAAIARLSHRLGGPGAVTIYRAYEPATVTGLRAVQRVPQVLAAVLAVIAAAAVAHLLVTATRRRRHELATLKTLGLVPRQVSSVIAWQASFVACASCVIGIPLGFAAGRWVWTIVARSSDVVVATAVPWPVLLALLPATLLVANAVGAAPAYAAGRIRPAAALRAE